MKIFKSRKYQNSSNSINIDGKEYDLSFLQPIQTAWGIEKKNINISFEFTTHVFSEAISNNANDVVPNVIDGTKHFKNGNNRVFSIQRYNDAKHTLFDFITNKIHADWVLLPTAKRDLYICISRNYHIFLQIIKRKNKILIIISSAYRKDVKQGIKNHKGKANSITLKQKINEILNK